MPNDSRVTGAIFALHVVVGVLPDSLREVLALVTTVQDHLTIVADDTDRTQLGHEVGEDVGRFTVERIRLGLEVDPGGLGRRL